MYEGGLRVPFIFSGPGVSQNTHTDVPVTGLDILPTLARLAGYQDPLPLILDGGNLQSIIHNGGFGKVERNSPFLIFHQAANRKPISAIRWGNYKLVKDWRFNKFELFDLSKDIEEKNDLSVEMPELVEKLNDALIRFLDEANAKLYKQKLKTTFTYEPFEKKIYKAIRISSANAYFAKFYFLFISFVLKCGED